MTTKARLLFAGITLAVLALMACPLLILTGCSSVPNSTSSTAIIQKALDAVLPPTFTGYIKAQHANQYFTISFEGDGLKRTEQGWSWTWLRYHRQDHLPILPGFVWSSAGDVVLGQPPPASVTTTP